MKTDMKRTGLWALREVAAVAAVSAALLTTAQPALALSLGRLSVQSSLGESLRAEIDVTSLTPEEAANLRVRVAPPDSYRVAGIDYNPVLPVTQVVLERRPDGTAFLRISSDKSVQEPFVDLILELSWATGRLLREYTLLFDPPSGRQPAAPPVAVTAPVAAAPVVAATPLAPPGQTSADPAATPAPAEAPVASRAAPRAGTRPAAPVAPVEAVAADKSAGRAPADKSSAEGARDYVVKPGDTLAKIASGQVQQGVSLDQMLVSMFRGNANAFVGNNMNRLRTGAVLAVPSAEQAGAVDVAEARKFIQAQSADFNAYRQRLAGAVPAAQDSADAARRSGGKVQAEVQDRKPGGTAAADQLKLDKANKDAAAAALLEDKIAKERARKEAAARMGEINRNVSDLKALQPASAATKGAPVTASASGSGLSLGMPSSASSPASSVPAIAVTTPPVAPVVAVPASAASAVVAVASAPASAIAMVPPAASEPLSVPRAASAPVAMPEPDEPSLIDTLADNPLVLPGAGLLLAVLAGLGWYRLRGKNKNEEGVTSFLESRLQPDSFFGASGGQRIDTRDATGAPSSMSYSLSQIDAIGDVDPVAEADVYLAYGRDLQAEEILKEAMRANPDRLAIRTKLLEVYAKRRDTKGFELLAGELYGLTGGQGEEWTKTQELGRSIDPDNMLYEPGGAPHSPTGSGGLEPLGASTMPQSIVPSPSRFESPEPDVSLDDPAPSGSSAAVDLDISVPAAMEDSRIGEPSGFGRNSTGSGRLDSSVSNGVDFDTSDMPTAGAHSAPAQAVDLGGISLDLDALPSTGHGHFSQPSAPLDLPPIDDDGADPLARKIELAEEFRQIGDTEGARDLLQEVVERAEGALQAKARSMLDQLS
ncbi:MAG: hypothetical protein RL375_2928 [Pseudomonadota bacterium]